MSRRKHELPAWLDGIGQLPPLDENHWCEVAAALGLTGKLKQVVWLLMHGMSDKQIARELGIKEPTIRTYVTRIFQRLGVNDRLGLVAFVFKAARVCPPAGCR